jgi:hypothetical protein
MHHLQKAAEVEEVTEKKATTLKLSDWVKIIPLMVNIDPSSGHKKDTYCSGSEI